MLSKKAVYLVLILALALGVGIAGCARSDKELADAEAALREAQEAGAKELAPAEYEAAESLIAKAKELMAKGRHKEARDLLVEARYKAIEAKGKAQAARREAAMTDAERLARERELERMRAGLGAGNLEDIFFDFDRSDIRADARPVLDSNARIIKSSGMRTVVIEGYCDIRGTEEYNLALGQRRAESAKGYLVGLGVDPGVLEAVSRGETTQFAEGTSEWAYQQNRRAHFLVPGTAPVM
ncbi:MAG: OmpA family protein [Candidatus Caldarchaeum sp.]